MTAWCILCNGCGSVARYSIGLGDYISWSYWTEIESTERRKNRSSVVKPEPCPTCSQPDIITL